MSENYLMLNGERIELTEEQVKTLMQEEKKSPFARVEKYSGYFYIHSTGDVRRMCEDNLPTDEKLLSVANYCTDKAMMKQRAWHETLNRLLWRYSEEHGSDNEWNGANKHWFIGRRTNGDIDIESQQFSAKTHGVVYFKDIKTAQSAIEEIVKPFMKEHQEFVW